MESKRFDKALDEFIDLFNNLETDVPIIQFGEDVIKNIELAKQKYGEAVIDKKINIVVREMLSLLDLENMKIEETTADDTEKNK
ncbi:Membrane-integrating protein MstX [Virgibacillus salexigens]|uniref:Membrane-integrating protein MstX n=2 Tax=Virgibacillus TaxID=84406 RepID=A0A024Q969_9BACI|nr:Membrane-integrating protein MstX [Virgibacillus massiliensis]